MDRNTNSAALQQAFHATAVEHLVDPIGLRFVEESGTGEPVRSLVLSREGGKDGVAPWFRLEFNSPTNGCEAPHIALLELSDLQLRVRLQGDALIRSGTIVEPGASWWRS